MTSIFGFYSNIKVHFELFESKIHEGKKNGELLKELNEMTKFINQLKKKIKEESPK